MVVQTKPILAAIAYQPTLTRNGPVILGNVDYQEWERNLLRINEILITSGIEAKFAAIVVQNFQDEKARMLEGSGENPALTDKERQKAADRARRALRCTIARNLTGESYRDFSIHICESGLLQWFCIIAELDIVKVPGKSELQRFAAIVDASVIENIFTELNRKATEVDESGASVIMLEEAIEINDIFFDSTCVQANIHFPVDWVLLRDCTRTLMKGVILIREAGLKNRMQDPKEFMREMNKLCIAMSQTRRKKDSKKLRKKILRTMKDIVKKVRRHAAKHIELFEAKFDQTHYSEGKAREIIDRMRDCLSKLPEAVRQAHERIIGERQVPNDQKILSIYEDDLHVIVRGKDNAETEFGNYLLLGEQRDGLIVYSELVQDKVPADSKLLQGAFNRVERAYETPDAVCADRGFDSAENREAFDGKIYNAVARKSPAAMSESSKAERFRELNRRRSSTEGRIGIFKNCFLGRPLRSKGFTRRATDVAWAVLAHNLWVLARLPRVEAVAQAA